MKKNDWILIGIILFIICTSFVLSFFYIEKGKANVIISISGEVWGEYSLDEDQEIKINSGNVLEIKDGQAYMKKADCPDQICTEHAPIQTDNEVIICLPNKVVVEIQCKEEAEIDAFSN